MYVFVCARNCMCVCDVVKNSQKENVDTSCCLLIHLTGTPQAVYICVSVCVCLCRCVCVYQSWANQRHVLACSLPMDQC